MLVKLHKGMKLATVQPIEYPELIANIDQLEPNSSDEQPLEPSAEIQQQIWSLIECSGEALDKT